MKRKLQQSNPFVQILKLTQVDYDMASSLIPDEVMPGSGVEDGWIFGVKEWREGRTEPRDPNLGGGMMSSTYKGFLAAKKEAKPK